tara:strand:- start:12 stop:200 length:189 start_codon:yes stop_codon:yes gene_type:complete
MESEPNWQKITLEGIENLKKLYSSNPIKLKKEIKIWEKQIEDTKESVNKNLLYERKSRYKKT